MGCGVWVGGGDGGVSIKGEIVEENIIWQRLITIISNNNKTH